LHGLYKANKLAFQFTSFQFISQRVQSEFSSIHFALYAPLDDASAALQDFRFSAVDDGDGR